MTRLPLGLSSFFYYSFDMKTKLINITDKIHDENNEILGETISDNQTIQEEKICLAVIRLDAVEKDLYINNQKINLIN